jgi:hypothetical protein
VRIRLESSPIIRVQHGKLDKHEFFVMCGLMMALLSNASTRMQYSDDVGEPAISAVDHFRQRLRSSRAFGKLIDATNPEDGDDPEWDEIDEARSNCENGRTSR